MQSDTVALHTLKAEHPDEPASSLYGNAAKISTHSRQAFAYEQAASDADLCIRPLLLYYAYLHWMKTVLYLSDLSYPRGSSLLQHGMSVRKVKRDGYRWPLDYAYIYKEGVLQSFRNVIEPELHFPTKLPIGHLLGSIPKVSDAIAQLYPEFQHVYPVVEGPHFDRGGQGGCRYVSRHIASNVGMTPEEWADAYAAAYDDTRPSNRTTPQDSTIIAREINAQSAQEMMMEASELHVADQNTARIDRDPEGLLRIPTVEQRHPWEYECEDGGWLADGHAYPLWLSHLVTVYVLSTLCRYNAVEWLDIVSWNNDRDGYLVREYLQDVPHFPELMESVSTRTKPHSMRYS